MAWNPPQKETTLRGRAVTRVPYFARSEAATPLAHVSLIPTLARGDARLGRMFERATCSSCGPRASSRAVARDRLGVEHPLHELSGGKPVAALEIGRDRYLDRARDPRHRREHLVRVAQAIVPPWGRRATSMWDGARRCVQIRPAEGAARSPRPVPRRLSGRRRSGRAPDNHSPRFRARQPPRPEPARAPRPAGARLALP
jgi:hypothetical protein